MSVLNDASIRGLGEDGFIDPFDPKRVQPASIDLTLGHKFKLWDQPQVFTKNPDLRRAIDLDHVEATTYGLMTEFDLDDGQSFILDPQAFCLASTRETIRVLEYHVARVEGKSSLGRLGLVVHATAGFCDPGFCGTITLELFNMNPNPLIIRPGRAICQLSFMKMNAPAEIPYGHESLGSKYQNQKTTTESRYVG